MKRYKYEPNFSVITKKEPEKALVFGLRKKGGRNSQGRITVRHQGGGHKRLWREIDFKQDKFGIPAKVASIEYDPNRNAFIALLNYTDGEKRYAIASKDMKVDDQVITSEKATLIAGNRLPLKKIPVGFFIYNVELAPGRGGQLGRSAGTTIQVMAQEAGYTNLLLPSGEIRMVLDKCLATIGAVSNPEHNTLTIAKAGRSRWMGIRPTVRGTAMNPRDHPHGGGEGKTGIGLRRPKTPWGKTAKGVRTRNKNKKSNQYILSRRIK